MKERRGANESFRARFAPKVSDTDQRGAGYRPHERWLRTSAFLLLGLIGLVWPRDGHVQLLTKVGSFVAPIGGNLNQAVTGLGFTPRAVVFYWTAQSTTGFATNAVIGYGFATATADRAVTFASQNNVYPNAVSRSQWTTRCIAVMNWSGTVDGEASLNSMDADGFTVRWQPAGSTA